MVGVGRRSKASVEAWEEHRLETCSADMSTDQEDFDNEFLHACEWGDSSFVRREIARDESRIHRLSNIAEADYGITALHYACR